MSFFVPYNSKIIKFRISSPPFIYTPNVESLLLTKNLELLKSVNNKKPIIEMLLKRGNITISTYFLIYLMVLIAHEYFFQIDLVRPSQSEHYMAFWILTCHLEKIIYCSEKK